MKGEQIDEEYDWLAMIQTGDDAAAEKLVDVYYQRLVGVARRRLASMPPQIADDEGAVISALRSFFSGIQDGKFPDINGQDDLWRILATITARKAVRQLRTHWRAKGQADHVRAIRDVEQLLSPTATPEDEAILIDECQRYLDMLPEGPLREIANMRMQGFETKRIAEQMQIHVRSVQRKLKLIEATWMGATDES